MTFTFILIFIPFVFCSIRRAVYVLDTTNAAYVQCSLPTIRRYAAAYNWPLHQMTAPALARRKTAHQFALQQLQIQRNTTTSAHSSLDDDGHFAKLQVFADALERAYDEILYIDVDVLLNENHDIPNVFEAARLPSDSPAVAMYGQGAPKQAIFDAILRINPRLTNRVTLDQVNYWNTGVVVINRLAMQRLKPLVETLFAAYVSRGLSIDSLPFFDQGFTNAVLWDTSFGIRVRPLSFAWNTSHSKFFYHHGDRFWLKEPEFVNSSKQFVPYVFHFMGCAGRNKTTTVGEQCKYERMQEFAKSHLNMAC